MSDSQTYVRSNPWLYLKWGVIVRIKFWSHIFLSISNSFILLVLSISTLYQGFSSFPTLNFPFNEYVFPELISLGGFST